MAGPDASWVEQESRKVDRICMDVSQKFGFRVKNNVALYCSWESNLSNYCF